MRRAGASEAEVKERWVVGHVRLAKGLEALEEAFSSERVRERVRETVGARAGTEWRRAGKLKRLHAPCVLGTRVA